MAKATLLQAVKEAYDLIGGGLPTLWLDEPPEGQGYPRAILSDGGQQSSEELDTGGTAESCVHPFSITLIYLNDSDAVETLGLLVLTAFTPTAVALTADPNAILEHDKRRVTTRRRAEQGPGDVPLYEQVIEYSARYGTNY